MKRREFITLFCGTTAMWPLAARAQQNERVHRIGFLTAGASGADNTPGLPAFVNGLQQLGWVDGKNIIIEYRYAENHLNRLSELATELVQLKVDVIVAAGTLAPLALKRATATIPTVMTSAGDPLGTGLVASLARPGGNITGLSLMSPEIAAKRLELLKDVVPELARVAVIWNAANPYPAFVFKETQRAASQLKIGIQSLEVRVPDDINSALDAALQEKADALITVEDPLTQNYRKQIADFAAKNRLPTMAGLKEYVNDGGLLSYGPNLADLYRRAAGYVDKILTGAKPGDLPVEQPAKFELVINQKTARLLGLTLPAALAATADEVIE